MTELQEKYLSAFSLNKMRHALGQIDAQKSAFLTLLQEKVVRESMEKLGVTILASGSNENVLRLGTPIGEIKTNFVGQLEGDHLGVAAVFSFGNETSQDEKFFVLRMNFKTPWVDSTGVDLEVDFHSENPTVSAFVSMLRRVLAMRLQVQEASLGSA